MLLGTSEPRWMRLPGTRRGRSATARRDVEPIPSGLDSLARGAPVERAHGDELARSSAPSLAPAIDCRRSTATARAAESARSHPASSASCGASEHERRAGSAEPIAIVLDRLRASDAPRLATPRQLIAMDLRLAREPDNDDLSFDRDSSHEEISATNTTSRASSAHDARRARRGPPMTASPGGVRRRGGALCRDIDCAGPVERVDANLALRARETRPWLRRSASRR